MPFVLKARDIDRLRDALRDLRACLTLEPTAMQARILSALRTLFRAESAGLFLQRNSKRGYIELVASEPKKPSEPLSLAISDEEGKGLTGFLATRKDVEAYGFQGAMRHRARAQHNPTHLSTPQCYSVLGIPIRGRRGYLLGLLKFENKLGRRGVAHRSDRFSEADLGMARLIAEMVAMLIESSLRRSNLLSLANRLAESTSPGPALRDVVEAASEIFAADSVDLALLDEKAGNLVIAEHVGTGKPKVGQQIPRESLAYEHWALDEDPLRIIANKGRSPDAYLGRRTAAVFKCRLSGSPKAMLILASSTAKWFGEEDRPLFELLEPLVGQALEKTRSDGQQQWPPSPPGIAWIRVSRRTGKPAGAPPLDRLEASFSPSLPEMFGLPATAKRQDYFDRLGRGTTQLLQALITKAVLEGDRKIEKMTPFEFEFNPALKPRKTIRFFASCGEGEVVCTLLDVTEDRNKGTSKGGLPVPGFWRKILQLAPVSCSGWEGDYEWVSEATARMYGFKSVEAFRNEIRSAKQIYADPERRKELLSELAQFGGRVEGFEFQATKWDANGNDSKIWVSENVQCYRMRPSRGKPVLLGTFADITERKAMENKLCLVGVAGVFLHDAERPFTQIYTEAATAKHLLERQNVDERKLKGCLSRVRKICVKGRLEANNFLQIAKGQKQLDSKPQDLLSNLHKFAQQACTRFNLKVEFAKPLPKPCHVVYDTRFLREAFSQIFKNAAMAMRDRDPEKPNAKMKCLIEVSKGATFVIVMIKDYGRGFREGTSGTGWRAISRIHASLKGRGGLGLTICNAVVEILGGEMTLCNWKKPNRQPGGCVRLRFPLHQAETKQ